MAIYGSSAFDSASFAADDKEIYRSAPYGIFSYEKSHSQLWL